MPSRGLGCVVSTGGLVGSSFFFVGFPAQPHRTSGSSTSATRAGWLCGLECRSLMLCFTDRLVGQEARRTQEALNAPGSERLLYDSGFTQCEHYKGKM